MEVDPRLRAAMLEQLSRRREAIAAGAEHVGWKLGIGERERIAGSIAVGYLTSATRLVPGTTYDARGADVRADVEIAVELREDVDPGGDLDTVRDAIAFYATALEIVDLAPVLRGAEAVVATNVFHRAVAFGPMCSTLPHGAIRATARVSGEERATAKAELDLADRLLAAARILDSVGQQLRRGDQVITGSILQVPLKPGDDVEAELEALGSVRLRVQ